jgi:RHS repeat-associated protein
LRAKAQVLAQGEARGQRGRRSYRGRGKREEIDYTYDVFDNLIGREDTTYTSGGSINTQTIERDVVDPATGNVVLSFDGNGNLTNRYLWGPAVDQILADEQFNLSGTDQLPSSAGNTLWALDDNQGSVTDLVDDAGTLEEHLAYSPFGQQTAQSSNPGSVDFDFGYDGTYTDATTGDQLHDLRWYDAAMQRWLNQDPTGLTFGPNPYAYVGNSPTNLSDPSGLCAAQVPAGMNPNAALPAISLATFTEEYRREVLLNVLKHNQDSAEYIRNGGKTVYADGDGPSRWSSYKFFLKHPDRMDADLLAAHKVAKFVASTSLNTAVTVGTGGLAGAAGGGAAGNALDALLDGNDLDEVAIAARNGAITGAIFHGVSQATGPAVNKVLGSALGECPPVLAQRALNAASGAVGNVLGGATSNAVTGTIDCGFQYGLKHAFDGAGRNALLGGILGALSPTKTGCFLAGTPVATEFGHIAVQDIKAEDRVWSYDLIEQEWKLCRVVETYQTEYVGDKVRMLVVGEWIESTRHHPVWVTEGQNLDNRPRPGHVRSAETAGATIAGRWSTPAISRRATFCCSSPIAPQRSKRSKFNPSPQTSIISKSKACTTTLSATVRR